MMHQLTIFLLPDEMATLIAYTSHTNYCCDRVNQPRVDLNAVAAKLLVGVLKRNVSSIRSKLQAELATLDDERNQLLKLLDEPTGAPGVYHDIHHDLEANEDDFRTVSEELAALEVK